MRLLPRLLWYWGPLALYAGLIFVLSSMSHPPLPTINFAHMDKALHLVEYAGFGFLMCRALALGGDGLSPRTAFLAAAVLGALYGATDELHQMFVPDRDASLYDLLTDIIGATLGGLVYWVAALRRVVAVDKVAAGTGGPSVP